MSDDGRVFLLELLFVLVTVGSLTAVAIPKSGEIRRRGTAERVLSDVEVVRAAVYQFYSDSAYFPQELPTGIVPEGLEPYLPRNFSLRRPWGILEYRNWPAPGLPGAATPGDPAPRADSAAAAAGAPTNVVGVAVLARDPRVGAMAAARAQTAPRFTVGNVHTFVIFGG